MSDATHVNDKRLLRAIDGEMTPAEHAEFDAHLVRCEACLERYEALAEFSNEIEKAIDATPVQAPRSAREQLIEALAGDRIKTPVSSGRQGWWWAPAAIAASAALLFFALRAPKEITPKQEVATHQVQANPAPVVTPLPQDVQQPARSKPILQNSTHQQIAGHATTSAFIRLPYVDAAQPIQTAGLLRVQMKLSMLANAGVIRMMPGASDGPVQADVLLGLDGQPYAIRLVSASQ